MEQEKLEITQQMSMEELIIYLEDMAGSLKNGRLVIEQGDDYVSLEPGRTISVEIKAKQKKDKAKVKLEFSWSTSQEEEAGLEITSEEPEKEEV